MRRGRRKFLPSNNNHEHQKNIPSRRGRPSAAVTISKAQAPDPAIAIRPDGKSIERREIHVIGKNAHDLKSAPVTFIGVLTRPVDATLTAQLSIERGAGLVVSEVVPDSPAAGALAPNDILLKLDDQLLFDTNQLSRLVKSYKADDEVTLTYLRAGKSAKAKVKLVTRELPQLTWTEKPGHRLTAARAMVAPLPAGEADRVFRLVRDGNDDVLVKLQHPGGATIINRGTRNIVFSDENGNLEINEKDGKKSVTFKDPKGDVVFSGPANTPEEIEKMPPPARKLFDQAGDLRAMTFKSARAAGPEDGNVAFRRIDVDTDEDEMPGDPL